MVNNCAAAGRVVRDQAYIWMVSVNFFCCRMRSKTPAVPAGLKGASTCGGVQERIGASRPLSGQGRRLNK